MGPKRNSSRGVLRCAQRRRVCVCAYSVRCTARVHGARACVCGASTHKWSAKAPPAFLPSRRNGRGGDGQPQGAGGSHPCSWGTESTRPGRSGCRRCRRHTADTPRRPAHRCPAHTECTPGSPHAIHTPHGATHNQIARTSAHARGRIHSRVVRDLAHPQELVRPTPASPGGKHACARGCALVYKRPCMCRHAAEGWVCVGVAIASASLGARLNPSPPPHPHPTHTGPAAALQGMVWTARAHSLRRVRPHACKQVREGAQSRARACALWPTHREPAARDVAVGAHLAGGAVGRGAGQAQLAQPAVGGRRLSLRTRHHHRLREGRTRCNDTMDSV